MNHWSWTLALMASLSMSPAWANPTPTVKTSSSQVSTQLPEATLKVTTEIVRSEAEVEDQDVAGDPSLSPQAGGQLDAASHALCVEALQGAPSLVLPALTPTDSAIIKLYQDAIRQRTPKDETLATLAKIDPKKPEVLADYIAYWPIYINYAKKSDEPAHQNAMKAFIESHPDGYIHERAIRDFLAINAKKMDGATYLAYYKKLAWSQNDLDIKAWYWVHTLRSNPDPQLVDQALAFMRSEPLKGEILVTLGLALVDRNAAIALPVMNLIMQKGRWDSARQFSQQVMNLPGSEKERYQLITNPSKWIAKHASMDKVPTAFIYWTGLRLARTEPEHAIQWANTHEKRLSKEERSTIITIAAYEASTSWKPEALTWFQASPLIRPAELNQPDLVLAWRARTDLMHEDWKDLILTIGSMDDTQQRDPTWQYWWGRALEALHQSEKAKPHFEAIAQEPSFYGLLAREALGLRGVPPAPINGPIVQIDLVKLENDPNFQRAQRFYQLELYGLGHREWNWGLQQWPKHLWPAIAQWAAQKGLWHRSIQLAERLDWNQDVLNLRYPTPLLACVQAVAQAQQVSPAWLYGLIRQESRFMPSARSSTNAMGWMQVMPNTGKLVARRANIEGFHPDQLSDVAVNLQIGSLYLKGLHDALSDQTSAQALALASYNAGPRRVTQWRARMTMPLEGAIFIESIPFYETRDYVKNVLSNMYFYQARMNLEQVPFKTLVGDVTLPTQAGNTP